MQSDNVTEPTIRARMGGLPPGRSSAGGCRASRSSLPAAVRLLINGSLWLNHRTAATRPAKDASLCSIARPLRSPRQLAGALRLPAAAGEEKVGPTAAFYSWMSTGMHGPTCTFWANLTTFSLPARRGGARHHAPAGAAPRAASAKSVLSCGWGRFSHRAMNTHHPAPNLILTLNT